MIRRKTLEYLDARFSIRWTYSLFEKKLQEMSRQVVESGWLKMRIIALWLAYCSTQVRVIGVYRIKTVGRK